MLRKICIIFVLVLSTLTFGRSQEESKPLVIPSEYQHAKEILDHLYNKGLNIQEIHNSKYTAFFNTNPNNSMYIKTDMGIFELVHLERKNGKEIDIVVQEATDNGEYKYVVSENGVDRLLILGAENYFNKSDEYITIARNKDLNDKIKQALKAQ
ncbi:hypothetical protein [Paenibacillus chitinolyticus]|uniref:hypothetical protein n=1 Tax=Paenibacillus chitinolyticus TaxID=79263 RepID=UPI00366E8E46